MLLDIATFIFALVALLTALFLLIIVLVCVVGAIMVVWEFVKQTRSDDGS